MLLQQMDYLTFLISTMRGQSVPLKDAEFPPQGASGVYGGYQPWISRADASARPATDRSTLGYFQQADAVRLRRLGGAEWECCLKDGRYRRVRAANLSRRIIRFPDGRLMISPRGGSHD